MKVILRRIGIGMAIVLAIGAMAAYVLSLLFSLAMMIGWLTGNIPAPSFLVWGWLTVNALGMCYMLGGSVE